MGRPSDYSDELVTTICARLASGESLSRICRDDDMPGLTTVYVWLTKHDDFRELYARAREDQADTLADEIIDIADDGRNDTYMTDKGEAVDYDVIARSKLRVDARKWVAAKLKPKKYGEKVSQEVSGPDGSPLQIAEVAWNVVKPSA